MIKDCGVQVIFGHIFDLKVKTTRSGLKNSGEFFNDFFVWRKFFLWKRLSLAGYFRFFEKSRKFLDFSKNFQNFSEIFREFCCFQQGSGVFKGWFLTNSKNFVFREAVFSRPVWKTSRFSNWAKWGFRLTTCSFFLILWNLRKTTRSGAKFLVTGNFGLILH